MRQFNAKNVLFLVELPRYIHPECPNPEKNAIEKIKCNYQVVYAGHYCEDSIFQGMYSLLTCEQLCTEDPDCYYIDYDPTSGCYHSSYCQSRQPFENSNVKFFFDAGQSKKSNLG